MTVSPSLGASFSQIVIDKELLKITLKINLFRYNSTELERIKLKYGNNPRKSLLRF